MSTIFISKTEILTNGKRTEVNRLRVNTRVDQHGNAINSAWRDATDDVRFADAQASLEGLGYQVDKTWELKRVMTGGKVRHTRMIRFTRTAAQAELPVPVSEPTSEPAPAKPKKAKPSRSAAQHPRRGSRSTPGGGGKKNAEQVDQQLREQLEQQIAQDLAAEGMPPEYLDLVTEAL